MISTFIIVFISLLNMLLAIGMVYTFEDVKMLKNKTFRLFILIPPVAITIAFCITIYGILYCLYILLSNYLK
jgi:hypothetical protein